MTMMVFMLCVLAITGGTLFKLTYAYWAYKMISCAQAHDVNCVLETGTIGWVFLMLAAATATSLLGLIVFG
jgi:hypothetical protein